MRRCPSSRSREFNRATTVLHGIRVRCGDCRAAADSTPRAQARTKPPSRRFNQIVKNRVQTWVSRIRKRDRTICTRPGLPRRLKELVVSPQPVFLAPPEGCEVGAGIPKKFFIVTNGCLCGLVLSVCGVSAGGRAVQSRTPTAARGHELRPAAWASTARSQVDCVDLCLACVDRSQSACPALATHTKAPPGNSRNNRCSHRCLHLQYQRTPDDHPTEHARKAAGNCRNIAGKFLSAAPTRLHRSGFR